MNLQNDFFEKNQSKEILFNNTSKINLCQNLTLQKDLNKLQTLNNNNNQNQFHKINQNNQNLKNQIKIDNMNNCDILLLKFNKLMNLMNKFSNVINKEENIKSFQRKILIDYSNNITFILPYKSKKNNILTDNKSFNNIIQKETLKNNLILGNKIQREINKLEYEQYNKSNEEGKSREISRDKIIEIKKFENDKLKDNDVIKFNYNNFTFIKKLLIELNFKINKEYNKVYKKYFFYLSNILFIITINKIDLKIIEILEKKGNKETKLNTEKYITKELAYIKSYLEKRKSIL